MPLDQKGIQRAVQVKLGEALRSQYELARPLSDQLYALVKELERRETVVLDFMATPRLRKQIAPHVTRVAVALRHGSAPQPWSLGQRSERLPLPAVVPASTCRLICRARELNPHWIDLSQWQTEGGVRCTAASAGQSPL
jgi:hypothetical protein